MEFGVFFIDWLKPNGEWCIKQQWAISFNNLDYYLLLYQWKKRNILRKETTFDCVVSDHWNIFGEVYNKRYIYLRKQGRPTFNVTSSPDKM